MNKKLRITLIAAGVVVVVIIAALAIIMGNRDNGKAYRVIKVDAFEGTVNLIRNDDDKNVFEGMKLKSKDRITTGKESHVMLLADSDKHILARENTCFSIKSQGTEFNGKIEIKLEYGSTYYDIESRLSSDSEFKVKTPNATASVRGTKFEVIYYPEKIETHVNVIEGKVEVTSDTEEMLVEAGQNVIIKSDGRIYLSENGDNTSDIPENAPKYLNETAFEATWWRAEDTSGIWVKQLEGWTYGYNTYEDASYHEFTKAGVSIRYFVMDIQDYARFSGGVNKKISKEIINSDGDVTVFELWEYKGEYGKIEFAYSYYKQITEDLRLMVYIYDEDGGESLGNAPIYDMVELTTEKYYSTTNIEGGVEDTDDDSGSGTDSEEVVGNLTEQELSEAIKGNITMAQLKLLLEIGQQCMNNSNLTHAQVMLNKIYFAQRDNEAFTPIELRNDGTVFDLNEINTVLSVISNVPISEENIYSSNTISDNKLFFKTCDVTRGGWLDATIDKYYRNSDGEILVEFSYSETYGSAGMSGMNGKSIAHLVENADGEYVIERIEEVSSEKWSV